MLQPFEVNWETSAVEKVLAQVGSYQLPRIVQDTGWQLGCDADYLQKLQHYWLNNFNWREAQTSLNRYPQFIASIDNLDIHFVHVVGEAQGKRPLLLTHGWPGSHFEFWSMIEALAYPSRSGGNSKDAFDLVIPSLPGFGFSGKPQTIMGQRETATLWNTLMTQVLGYDKYLAQGGDYGAIVSSWLGLDYPERLHSIHLNALVFRSTAPAQNEDETRWLEQMDAAYQQLSGYSHLQVTKPLSLIRAMQNNPMAQAGWIIERFHDWSDLSEKTFESLYSLDDLLTNIMIYVMTDSFASSVMYYPGLLNDNYLALPEGQRANVPTAYAAFPGDALIPVRPRSRAALSYNITRWTAPPTGGHFAALEQPEWLVNDLRAWAASLARVS
jgi:pimeloyl-ACP methyl ester carboxylesterase